jgi:hypothetical protein
VPNKVIIVSAVVAMLLPASPATAAMPGGNGRVLDTLCRSGANRRCYVRVSNLSGVGKEVLTRGRYVLDLALAWSPDGRRILYSRTTFRNGFDYKGMFTIDQNGENRRKVTEELSGAAAFSPNGKRIAVASSGGVSVIRRDGSHRKFIYDAGDDPSGLAPGVAWLTSGRIAFLSYRNYGTCETGMEPDVWTIKPDGTKLRRVTHNGYGEGGLDASPDGKWLMYESFRPCPGGENHLFRVKLNGSSERRVTRYEEDGLGVFSPDGRHVLLSRGEIITMSGETVRPAEMFGAWQPVRGTKPGRIALTLKAGRTHSSPKDILYIAIRGRIATKIRGIEVHPVLYQRRNGSWIRLDGDRVATDRRGGFEASVADRPNSGTCRLVVYVPRTTEHRRVKAIRRFPCRRPGSSTG